MYLRLVTIGEPRDDEVTHLRDYIGAFGPTTITAPIEPHPRGGFKILIEGLDEKDTNLFIDYLEKGGYRGVL
jgi:hypothetical protein